MKVATKLKIDILPDKVQAYESCDEASKSFKLTLMVLAIFLRIFLQMGLLIPKLTGGTLEIISNVLGHFNTSLAC